MKPMETENRIMGYILILLLVLIPLQEALTYEKIREEPIIATITAYSSVETCEGDCIMASGNEAYIGAVACPREIKLHTRVLIDNTPYICEDRTSIRFNGRYDIFLGYGQQSYAKAIKFGKQKRQVQVLR